MAAGDYLIRRNAANTDTIPDTGGSLTTLWDTAVANQGSGITYSAGTFTLGETGNFLIIYSDQYGSTDTTNNERLNVVTELFLGGTSLDPIGTTTGYIRKSGGSQEFIAFGAAIVNVSSTAGTADELEIRHRRVDNTAVAGREPDRIADRSGVVIIKLDDSLGYGRYESSADFSTSATDNGIVTCNIGSTIEQESPFTRTGNTVDIATNNLVLAVYSWRQVTDAANSRTEYQTRLTLGGTVVPGSYTQSYRRNTDNSDAAGTGGMCLLRPTSGQDVELEIIKRDGTAGTTMRASLELVELPSTAKAIVVEATTGNYNVTATDFAWDTNPYIDTDVFTHTVGTSDIDVDVAGDYLVMASQATTSQEGATRAVPALAFRVNTTDIEYGANSSYHRNSGTSEWSALAAGTLVTGLSINDSIKARNDRIGTNGTAINTNVGGMSVIQLSSLLPATGTQTINVNQVEETDTSQGMTVVGGSSPQTINLNQTTETDATFAVTMVQVSPFRLADSANIVANGANTTAQLSAPAGKTTGNFTTGRIQDDENPADAVDIASGNYTELEWAIEATTAADTVAYTFRITDNGTVLDTYTVSPQWTVTAGNNQTITANLTTETDTAQPFTAVVDQAIAIGLTTEIDTANAFTGAFTAPVGQATEVDVAFAPNVVTAITLAIGLNTETDEAQVITVIEGNVNVGVGLASSVETANAITVSQGATLVDVNQALETDTANVVTPVEGAVTIAVGQTEETDLSQPVTAVPGVVTQTVNLTTETDLSQPVTVVEGNVNVAVNQATESDTSQTITPVVGAVSVAVNQAEETDSADTITVVVGDGVFAIGQATETDFAQTITVQAGAISALVDQAVETDEAQSITAIPTVTITVGQSTEVDIAQPINTATGAITETLNQTLETDTAQSISPAVGTVIVPLGLAEETDTAFAIAVQAASAPAVIAPSLASPIFGGRILMR